MSMLFGSVLPWLLVGTGAWLGFQLVRQNGRILIRLESIERRIGQSPAGSRREPQGLRRGMPAPEFELPDLHGKPHKLSEFRGKDLALIFFNPGCGFCTQMLENLAKLAPQGSSRQAMPIVVTTGDPEENRKLAAEHGLECLVLLQEQIEVTTRYRAQGTPMGYRIDAAGRIASELAIGAEPLLKLADLTAPLPKPKQRGGEQTPPHGKEADPSLARSRLNRNGLKPGVEAPEFRLPRIDGGELALSELHGKRVLLVFSDPDCGPCDAVAPALEELHRSQPDLQVILVSRRDADASRAKAEKLGLTFPIVMQKLWEISLKYAMFATPAGYLIDEEGRISSDVAVGVEPILALAERAEWIALDNGPSPFEGGALAAAT